MKIFRKTTVEDEQKKQAVETRKERNKDDGEIRVFKERRKAGVSAKGESQHAPKHR